MFYDTTPVSKKRFVDHDELADAVNGLPEGYTVYFRYESEMIRVTPCGDLFDDRRVGMSISESEEDEKWDDLMKLIEGGVPVVHITSPVQFILKLPVTLEKCLETAASLVVENIHAI